MVTYSFSFSAESQTERVDLHVKRSAVTLTGQMEMMKTRVGRKVRQTSHYEGRAEVDRCAVNITTRAWEDDYDLIFPAFLSLQTNRENNKSRKCCISTGSENIWTSGYAEGTNCLQEGGVVDWMVGGLSL